MQTRDECLFPTQPNSFFPHISDSFSMHHQFQIFSNPFESQPQDQLIINPNPIHFSSNNSTSDDQPDEQQGSVDMNERKQRRMISNRESARRSRVRKQKQLDELWSRVVRLRNENHGLMDKLNHVSEDHDRVIQENSKLKEEACELRQMLCDLQIGSPCHGFRELDDDDLCIETIIP